MSPFERCLERVGRDLDDLGHPWALIGALAVAALSEARATLDVDVAVAVDDPADASRLVEGLVQRGYRWQAEFGTAMTSLAVPEAPPPGLRLDLLFALSGVESEVARAAERLAILPGVELPVALLGDLLALKLLSAAEPGREHDARDLRSLLARALPEDLERAHQMTALLERRGSAPGRDLAAELAVWIGLRVGQEP